MNSNIELIASIIRMNLGGVLSDVVQAGVAEMIKQADKRRATIADAAWFLFSVHQFTPNWLRASASDVIRGRAKANGEAAFKMGLPVGPLAVTFHGSGFAGMGLGVEAHKAVLDRCMGPMIEACIDIAYPLREKTAAAARFLWMTSRITSATQVWLNDATGKHIIESAARKQEVESMRTADAALYMFKRSEHPSWISWLISRDAESIRATAGVWQHVACEDTADAAWIAFRAGWSPGYLREATPKRIKAAAAIKDAPVGTMDIEGYGFNGERITVHGIVVRWTDSASLGALSERMGKQYGIAGVSSVSVGPFS